MVREKAEVEAAKGAAEGQAGRLTHEAERLRRRAQELENEVAKLNRIIDEAKLQESRLGDRVGRLEVRGQGERRRHQKLVILHCWCLRVLYVDFTEREEAIGRVLGRN